ncbi:response regulator [Paenibacillus eucommiae]|uniref:Two-component SAPR family response regulator n=1 Tax=Paenibacillus eucommiae TaxID=1355755 RepID=A0ABS4J4Z5_9BACL|nr:response regulator [Paenibacillus eucommiae]MBP1994907.1 two-component SAPR family response regulator [Paenibacillus eucommiae]
MNIILIDDEEPALVHLERLLKTDGRVQIAGKYTSAQEGLDHLARERVDIVFLDIGMPEMNGIEAGERIQQIDSSIRIVYITAYSNYAIEAFELHALDYLLKPVDTARMTKTLDRIEEYAKLSDKGLKENREEVVAVRCFKRLELVGDPGSREKLKWRTMKAQELFAYLLHLGGQRVNKDRLIETLWPDAEQDKAVTYLHHSVSRVRKLLKEWGGLVTIEYADDSYGLYQEAILTDVQLFERELSQQPYNFRDKWNHYEQILLLYRGDYLEDHDYEWAKPRRSALLERYLHLVTAMARHEMEDGRERSAAKRLLEAQERDPYSEEVCRLLLTAYSMLNDYTAIQRSFESFTELLQRELGVEPDNRTKEVYEELMKRRM